MNQQSVFSLWDYIIYTVRLYSICNLSHLSLADNSYIMQPSDAVTWKYIHKISPTKIPFSKGQNKHLHTNNIAIYPTNAHNIAVT